MDGWHATSVTWVHGRGVREGALTSRLTHLAVKLERGDADARDGGVEAKRALLRRRAGGITQFRSPSTLASDSARRYRRIGPPLTAAFLRPRILACYPHYMACFYLALLYTPSPASFLYTTFAPLHFHIACTFYLPTLSILLSPPHSTL